MQFSWVSLQLTFLSREMSEHMCQKRIKTLQGDHPGPQVLLLDRLQGHLACWLKSLLPTKIVALTSKRSLYVAYDRLRDLINICILEISVENRERKKYRQLTLIDGSHTLFPDFLFTSGPFFVPGSVFLGQISCSQNDEQLRR